MDKDTQWLWVSEKRVFEMTGRALSTLRNDRYQRRGIPFCKVGKSVRYRLSDVAKYMDQCRVETNQD